MGRLRLLLNWRDLLCLRLLARRLIVRLLVGREASRRFVVRIGGSVVVELLIWLLMLGR